MTDFSAREGSRQDNRPFEVYLVELGTEDPVRWTSGNKTINAPTGAPQEWMPERALSRTAIRVGEEERKRVLQITVSSENPIARRYIGNPPGQEATITIYRGQLLDPDLELKQIYKGSIMSAQFKQGNETAIIACQSIEAASSRTIPRYNFGRMCQHILYGPGCDVSPVPHTHTGSVTSASGSTSK